MIEIFVINLKKDKDKKEYIKKLFQKYNLEFEFIEGIYGKELSDDEIRKFYNKKLVVEKLGRELSKSEIGCALSHMKIYEKMVNENIQKAIVFEDDIYFDDKFVEFFKNIKNIPDYVDILLLGHHNAVSRNIKAPYGFFCKTSVEKFILRIPSETAYGAYGYYITLNGAKKLLKFKNNLFLPLDHYTGSRKFSEMFILEEPIIYLNEMAFTSSNLDEDRKKMDNINYIKIFIRKSKITLLKYYTLSFFKRLKGVKCFLR